MKILHTFVNKTQIMAKGYKTGGRRRGSANHITRLTRELLTDFMTENYDGFKDAMAQLPAIDFVRAYISIIKYVVPTLQSVSMEQNKSKQTTIEETLIKLSGEAEEESKKVYYR